MSDRKRLHRGDPARTTPIRNFSKLYSKAETTNGAANPKTSEAERTRRTPAVGPLAHGVELAYSVIEKYITEGRRTAEGLSTQPYATRPANDNLQDILERVLRFQAEILPLWIDTLATLVKVEPLQNGHAARGIWPHFNGKSSESMAVAIEVASIRPVQVSVELRPDCDPRSLVALNLNSPEPRKPPLTQVSLVAGEVEGRVKLRVQIPDKQPSGTYAGVIVSRHGGEALGTVSVRIAN